MKVDRAKLEGYKSFAGVRMQQNWPDLELWEHFLNRTNPQMFVELGTGNGGMAIFLALQCYQRAMSYYTFDNFKLSEPAQSILSLLQAVYAHVNIWDEGRKQVEDALTRLHPTVLFCDDGNKRREYQEFVPLLQQGDYVVVHDYGSEFTAEDVDPTLTREIMGDECDAVGSITRFYERL